MSHVTYKIVQHDGGWAYTVDGVFSEPFPTHAAALAAAKRVAAEQRVPGRTETIEYETADGKWHTETAAGSDRPEREMGVRLDDCSIAVAPHYKVAGKAKAMVVCSSRPHAAMMTPRVR